MSNLVPDLPELRFPLTEQQVGALGRFLFQVNRVLSGGITSQNSRTQILDTVIQWPQSFTPEIATRPRLTKRPAAVQLVYARVGESATTPATLAAALEWDWRDGLILLPQFVNSSLRTRWLLRLLVTEA